jgi:DNA-binding MarR family transcriptional regulator
MQSTHNPHQPFDIDATLGYLVNRTSAVMRQELQRRFRAVNQELTAEAWALMGQLWKEDGLTRQQLADRTIKDETTVTRFLDGLVRKGLIRREQHPIDRRVVQTWLTEQGRQLQGELVPVAQGLMGDASRGILQGDMDVTLRTLRLVLENLLDSASGAGEKA